MFAFQSDLSLHNPGFKYIPYHFVASAHVCAGLDVDIS